MTESIHGDFNLPTLSELAKEACEKHKDAGKAKRMILNRLAAQPALRDSLLDQMVSIAVADQVYRRRNHNLDQLKTRNLRLAISRIKANPSTVNPVSIRLSKPVMNRSFLRCWTMRDGRVLGDYTGDELRKEAEINTASAKSNTRLATYYTKLADVVKDKTVGKAIDDAKAEAIWEATAE